MNDLSHWEAANDFTGQEAAALAVGLDPLQPGTIPLAKLPLYARMESCYNAARKFRLSLDDDPFDVDFLGVNNTDEMLVSCGLSLQIERYGFDDGQEMSHWLLDDNQSRFAVQRFTGQEIARWLSAIALKSKFSFAGLSSTPSQIDEKPMGTKERRTLLTIIAVVCKEANLDYTKASKTAGLIHGIALQMGLSIGETTIEGYLKKLPDVVESHKA